jgi:hypothetical protein
MIFVTESAQNFIYWFFVISLNISSYNLTNSRIALNQINEKELRYIEIVTDFILLNIFG